MQIARDLGATAILICILQAGHWVDVNSASMSLTEGGFNAAVRVGIMVAIAIYASRAVVTGWRLRPGAPAPAIVV